MMKPFPIRKASVTTQRGMTLIELVLSIVIISITVVGVFSIFQTVGLHGVSPMVRSQSLAIAESYLEEIISQPFSDPDGTEAGENRATFDDVDDYNVLANNGCLSTSASCPTLGSCVCNRNGTPMDNLQGYNVNVAVTSDGNNLGAGIPNNQAYRIEVTVTHAVTNTQTVVSSYRANY